MFLDLIMHRMRIPLCGPECNRKVLEQFTGSTKEEHRRLTPDELDALNKTEELALGDEWERRKTRI